MKQIETATGVASIWKRTAQIGIIFFTLLMFFCGPPRPDTPPGLESDQPEVPPYEELAPRLKSENWSTRSETLLEIERGDYRQAIPEMLRLLRSDPHPAVRQTAALILGSFKVQEAAPIIARMLASDKEVSPDYLMEALARLEATGSAGAVVPYLNSPNDALRLTAVDTLERLNATAQGPRILSMAQGNNDSEKARTYAMALGKLKVRGAETYLIQLAGRSEPGPTLAASYLALGRIQSRRAVPLLSGAVAATFDKGRENAVIALIEIQDKSALNRMFPLMEHAVKDVRYAAAEVIAGIPDDSSGPRALQLLEQNSEVSMGPAAYVLGRLKYEPARASLEKFLKERSSPDRERLARALGWLGGSASNELLIAVLKEEDGEGRYGAAWSLGILGATEAIGPLQEAARSSDYRLATLAVEALGGIGQPEALDTLRQIAEDEPSLRQSALESISSIPGEESREILEDFATSDDRTVRHTAIRSLAERRSTESIPVLVDLLDDPDSKTVEAAIGALQAITDNKTLRTAPQWKFWYENQDD